MTEIGDSPLFDPDFPHRPAHPDFARLCEVILQMDGAFEDVETPEDHVAIMDKLIGEHVDPASVSYMAIQRGLRSVIVKLGAAPAAAMAGIWLDGFICGVKYQERRG